METSKKWPLNFTCVWRYTMATDTYDIMRGFYAGTQIKEFNK